ncbi:MAG: tetrahydrofolate dehydrogenase/cyclohydrolase catalytic domain-containing protein [Clostridia bacterium]|nr:tetrahydrofolate dehydrogenase/cyclohydrolase catalytic domain-containing protein [Clostridia bacterium]
MAELLKGAPVAAALNEALSARVAKLAASGIKPGMCIVRVGARPDDLAYERGVLKRFAAVGIECRVLELAAAIAQQDFIEVIKKINADHEIHGVLIFRPLPPQLDEGIIKHVLDPRKDMDCLTPENVAKVFEGDDTGYPPCTPQAVMEILDYYGVELKGKRVTLVGRSMVVGKPLAMMLLKRHATVTICHTRTVDLAGVCRGAEILIAAAGKAKMIGAGFVSPGQTVIDVGINLDEGGNLCGDVDRAGVEDIVAALTPVPGGVGAVTSSILAENVVRAAEMR